MAARSTKPDNRAIAGTKLAIRAKVLNYLAEVHSDEFHRLMDDEYTEAGLVYERPLSAREKAQEQLASIYAEFPELRPIETRQTDIQSVPRPRPVREEGGPEVDVTALTAGVDPDIRNALT